MHGRALAQELYNIVFCGGEVERALQGAQIKSLMWSLDDVLRYAPMCALHDGHKYLVESYAQSIFTLASYSRLKNEPRKSWTALGLGVSKAHPNFPPLPGVLDEMKAIIHAEGEATAGAGVLPGTVAMDSGRPSF